MSSGDLLVIKEFGHIQLGKCENPMQFMNDFFLKLVYDSIDWIYRGFGLNTIFFDGSAREQQVSFDKPHVQPWSHISI